MRLCFVLDYPLTNTGGIVTSTLSQIHALEQAGHDVFLLHADKTTLQNTLYVKPHFTLPIPGTPFVLPCVMNTKRTRAMVKQLLRDHDIEAVCLQTEMSLAWIVLGVAKEEGLPVLDTVHSLFWHVSAPLPGVVSWVVRQAIARIGRYRFTTDRTLEGKPLEQTLKSLTLSVAQRADLAISPSRHQAEQLKRLLPDTPVQVIANPFFPSTSKPPHLLTKSESGTPLRVVWVGRCAEEKRPLEFLEAVSSLDQQDITVEIIGDGPLLRAMRERYGQAKNIVVRGELSNDEVVAAIDRAELLAITSYHFDNQPMVIAEAISRARPVLYCDERLQADGLEQAGILTKSPAPADIANSLRSLVTDRSKLLSYSKAASAASNLFTPEHYCRSIEQAFVAASTHHK